jgi:hypothetical protein
MSVKGPKNPNNPRADGFAIYLNMVGDQIWRNILPKNKFAKDVVHKEAIQKKEYYSVGEILKQKVKTN